MDVNDYYGGSFLKVADLQGKTATVTISGAETSRFEENGKEQIILLFHGTDKKLGLNKTNALMIASFLGPQTDGWVGKAIEVYPDVTSYKGVPTPCIRVRQPGTGTNLGTAPAPAVPTTDVPGLDPNADIPF